MITVINLFLLAADKCEWVRSNCNAPTKPIGKSHITKTTNHNKKKKQTKVPNLDRTHILPKFNHTSPQNNSSTQTSKVLLLSYFNSGSPEIANILSRHPDIFYYNEPLLPFDATSLKDGEEPISRRVLSEAIDYLSDLFDCRILNSKMGYSDEITKKMAKKAFNSCFELKNEVGECVQTQCETKKVVMSKEIRIYFKDVQSFLMRNRDTVKVIILQRDPRVNLHLRNKKSHQGWWASGSDMFFQGRSLCSRMLHDVQHARRMEGSVSKDFYKIVLYEHFLKSPENILKGILSFIGLDSELSVVRELLRSANAYKDLKKAKLSRWTWIPDDNEALNVDKACSFFYKNSMYNSLVQKMGFVQRYHLCQYCD